MSDKKRRRPSVAERMAVSDGGRPLANGKAQVREVQGADPGVVRLATTRLDEIKPVPIRWLVPGYLPLGKLVLLAGDGGNGKSGANFGDGGLHHPRPTLFRPGV